MELKQLIEEISRLEELEKGYDKSIQAIQDEKRELTSSISRKRGIIKAYMQENGVKQEEVDFGVVNIFVTLNEGKTTVDCPDINAVPEEFLRIKKEPDKKKISEFIKESPAIPNWAIFTKGDDYITIKSVIK